MTDFVTRRMVTAILVALGLLASVAGPAHSSSDLSAPTGHWSASADQLVGSAPGTARIMNATWGEFNLVPMKLKGQVVNAVAQGPNQPLTLVSIDDRTGAVGWRQPLPGNYENNWCRATDDGWRLMCVTGTVNSNVAGPQRGGSCCETRDPVVAPRLMVFNTAGRLITQGRLRFDPDSVTPVGKGGYVVAGVLNNRRATWQRITHAGKSAWLRKSPRPMPVNSEGGTEPTDELTFNGRRVQHFVNNRWFWLNARSGRLRKSGRNPLPLVGAGSGNFLVTFSRKGNQNEVRWGKRRMRQFKGEIARPLNPSDSARVGASVIPSWPDAGRVHDVRRTLRQGAVQAA